MRPNRLYRTLTGVVMLLNFFVPLTSSVDTWNPRDYPNPQIDGGLCGRSKTKSWVCDPAGFLSRMHADELDELVDKVTRSTISPCSESGYPIAIALLKDISPSDKLTTPPSDDDELVAKYINDKQQMVMDFTKTLLDRWTPGDCHDGVVILFSSDDNLLSVAAGEVSGKELTQAVLFDIYHKSRRLFSRVNQTATYVGLRTIINDMWSVFNGTYVMPSYETPSYGAVFSLASCNTPAAFVLSVTILVSFQLNFYSLHLYPRELR